MSAQDALDEVVAAGILKPIDSLALFLDMEEAPPEFTSPEQVDEYLSTLDPDEEPAESARDAVSAAAPFRLPAGHDGYALAAWAMRKRAAAERDLLGIAAYRADEIDRVERWAKQAKAAPEARAAWLDRLLADYARRSYEIAVENDPKAKASVTFPHGAVTVSSTQAKFVIDDDQIDDLIALVDADPDLEPLVRRTVVPAKSEWKTLLAVKVTDDGDRFVVVSATGERVPMVRHDPGGTKTFTPKPDLT